MSVSIVVISPEAPHGEPLPHTVYCDPESGNDHCLKEVNACLIWHRVDIAHVCIKDSI